MSSGLIQPPVDGEFYIDNAINRFYLREGGVWDPKGFLFRTDLVALMSPGPNPFTDGQIFELALGATDVAYFDGMSPDESHVECLFPAQGDCSLVLTDNLAGYLSSGTDVICTASFTAASHVATLAYNATIVRAGTPLWVVMPMTADPTMAGLRAIFSGMPQ